MFKLKLKKKYAKVKCLLWFLSIFVFVFVLIYAALSCVVSARETDCLTKGDTDARYNVLIWTLAYGKVYDVDRIVQNRIRYTERWGINYTVATELYTSFNDLSPSWHKIIAYFDYKAHYDYIWFLDADAVIMNGNCSIHAIIEAYDNGGLIIGKGYGTENMDHYRNGILNAGSFIVRTSDWSDSFMTEVYKLSYAEKETVPHIDRWWEQAAIDYLYKNGPYKHDGHISIVLGKVLDSYLWIWSLRPFASGDFVLHSCGLGYPALGQYLSLFHMTEF